MALKSVVASLTSPGVRALLRERHEYRNTKTYPTWEAAVIAANANYANDSLALFRAARQRANAGLQVRDDVLHLCVGLLGSHIEVTDFGGATGYNGNALLADFPLAKYTVVEVGPTVELANAMGTAIKFQTDIPDSCDVFFSRGTLQYLPSPMDVLHQGFLSARKAVVLTRNCFCDQEIFRVQTSRLFDNGAGVVPSGYQNVPVKYAHRTIVKADVIKLAERSGFSIAADLADPYNLDGGSLPYLHRASSGSLVFVRRS